MTDYKKYLKNKYLKNIKPEEFIEILNSRIKEFEEEINDIEKELFKLKKKQVRAKNLKKLEEIEVEVFLKEQYIKENKEKLSLIDDILQKLGWSIGFKREWKECGEK